MSFRTTIQRELEVAFSKDAQPVWFRIVKYILLGGLFYFLWGTRLLWIILLSLLVVGASLHFWFRRKTHGWTKSYGLWKQKNNTDVEEEK
jgi:hypothetical protein